ncbi:transporter substrate-binding domain-containing protein [Undibacterium seohonense]|uniref:Transporter substrate-binding domain-containing protein n=1 Tax=Undibacterium seohonense TaxID=1344950 RepID=A0ABR6X8S0_9BURK|nr:transporter substrate-binding domain-containing protein [Undibacterium seohonense]MBC3809286.1 transporter substrate-binding domain-containing protein [Undibacterium seohonense]
MRQSLLKSLFLLLFTGSCHALEPIRACGGDSNWPPMSYISEETKSIQGLSVQVLKEIFLKPTPEFKLRPWARCMSEVESLQGSDLIMSSFRTPEREQKFYFSRPYFNLTPAYFFARQRFAQAPITTLRDLSQYKVCSLHGAATSYVGSAASQIESGATNYLSLIRKIDRGHCEIVVDMKEVFLGLSKIGVAPFDAAHYKILVLPETQQLPLHFAISKRHPNAKKILEMLNKGIATLEKNGKLKQLADRDFK